MTDITTTVDQLDSPQLWATLKRPLPDWFGKARFGVFIHWGPYSVPAWAEPTGPLGTVPEDQWFAHNAYAEWYYNTMRIAGSPTAQHHAQEYSSASYDDFLDDWTASDFDPSDWAQLFSRAGAEYVIPTTKHHDGVALWDAPGTGARNTVHRGPRRDLVAAIADAVRREGLRFGVYYSGGLDWSITNLPPHTSGAEVRSLRPIDAAYNLYAYLHVADLVRRYAPDVLWNDIEWPDAGKRGGPYSLHALFEEYYAAVPEGVVNDRWGDTHWDFQTSEYEAHSEAESSEVWENCRGIGFSFGYNQAEDETQSLTGYQLAQHLTDVVSRGGRLLLNVGPTADGRIPDVQRRALEGLGRWMATAGPVLRESNVVAAEEAPPGDAPWVRWLSAPEHLVAIVDGAQSVPLPRGGEGFRQGPARVADGVGQAEVVDGVLRVSPSSSPAGPSVVLIPLT